MMTAVGLLCNRRSVSEAVVLKDVRLEGSNEAYLEIRGKFLFGQEAEWKATSASLRAA
jgi:hypothetical protein